MKCPRCSEGTIEEEEDMCIECKKQRDKYIDLSPWFFSLFMFVVSMLLAFVFKFPYHWWAAVVAFMLFWLSMAGFIVKHKHEEAVKEGWAEPIQSQSSEKNDGVVSTRRDELKPQDTPRSSDDTLSKEKK